MTLEKIVLGFRKGFLRRRKSAGFCWAICYPLQGYLSILGHQTEVTEGTVRGEHHVWLTFPDGLIIDPTADQFPSSKMPKVFIGKRPRFYRPAK